MRLLLKAVVDYAVYMLDGEGRVSTWNAGAQRIKGYAPAEIVGRHFSAFFTEEDRKAGSPPARSTPPAAPAAGRTRPGACARTARASGRSSCSTP